MAKKLRITLYISLTLFAMLMLSLYFFFNPAEINIFPKCPFHSITSYHCPGCGSQRAIHALLHGDIWTAVQYNFLIILAFLVGLYKLYLWAFSQLQKDGSEPKNILYANATPWIVFGIIIAFWILRNLPFKPFNYLAP